MTRLQLRVGLAAVVAIVLAFFAATLEETSTSERVYTSCLGDVGEVVPELDCPSPRREYGYQRVTHPVLRVEWPDDVVWALGIGLGTFVVLAAVALQWRALGRSD